MRAVSVWHFCLVLAAADAGSCEDGETSLVQVGSGPVESWKQPRNKKKESEGLYSMVGFKCGLPSLANEMNMTVYVCCRSVYKKCWKWDAQQGVKSRVPITICLVQLHAYMHACIDT